MSKELAKSYNGKFYDARTADALRSAQIILGRLFEVYQPRCVVDFGCGQGSWLRAAELLGSETLKGFDGPWVNRDKLLSDKIDFTAVDLEHLEPTPDRYDLAISLEVAEHLTERAAQPFIAAICRAADVVLFSAAIKHQGGTRHINEQWQSYWIELFQRHDFTCFDIFRGALWHNQEVDWWYRQNTFLFVRTGSPDLKIDLARLKSMQQIIPDVAHPENYQRKATPLRTAWRDLREFFTGPKK